MFPMTVRIVDVNFNNIIPKFYNLNLMIAGEASRSSCEQSIKNLFEKCNMKWEKVTGNGLDGKIFNTGW